MAKGKYLDSLNEGAENPDEEPVSVVTKAPPPAPAPQLITLSMEQFHALLASAQGQQTGGTDLATAITEGMKQVQQPIPENKVTDEISAANPLGDRPYPRSGFGKCDFHWGVIKDDAAGTVVQGPAIDERDSTIWELLALNTLDAGEKTIKRLDRAPLRLKVYAHRNQTTNRLERIVVGLPANIIGRQGENRNMVPDLTDIVRQYNGHDLRAPEDGVTPAHLAHLKALYAAHKAGHYISTVETVAA